MSTRLSAIKLDTTSFVDLLRWRARLQPQHLAYTFLHFKGAETNSFTYQELDWQARSIAGKLQRMGITKEPVLLLYPPGLEYIAAFFGCLYADVIPVPAYPPHSGRAVPRIQAIAADAQARLVLTTEQVFAHTGRWFAKIPGTEAWKWCITDKPSTEDALSWQEPVIAPDSVAFLQYTSGSTSTPRGVMVSHQNLLHNAAFLSECMHHSERSTNVSWLPFFHDLGLIAGVLQPLYIGTSAILMTPTSFLQRPLRWLQAISDFRATTTYAPNFAYDLCVNRSTPEERACLDLSCLENALNGAEPIRAETLDAFSEAFAVSNFKRTSFVPAYGMAETTLVVTVKKHGDLPVIRTVKKAELEKQRAVYAEATEEQTNRTVQRIVSCGVTGKDLKVIIVNPEQRTICPQGEIGEIWVSGESVTQGYWKRDAETEETFYGYLADTREGPFVRTGDLGFAEDDEIFVTGRIKDVIIIHGRNHYPQDLELTAEHSHPAIRANCSAAFYIQGEYGEELIIALEVDHHYQPDADDILRRPPFDRATIVKAIRQAIVEEHDVMVSQIVLLRAGGLPKTSSGKIQRRACQAAFLTGSLEETARFQEKTIS